jgi:hypothetical protein
VIDRNLLLRGLRIRNEVLRVKEILSQHIVLRQEAMTAVRGVPVLVSFTGVGLQGILNWGMRKWTVVGIFDAGNTGVPKSGGTWTR